MGNQRYTTRAGRTNRREGRALTGFIDGTSNLDPAKNDDDARLVFVDPAAVTTYPPLPRNQAPGYNGPPLPQFPEGLREPPASEPEWTKDGTYLVVRASVINTPAWDAESLDEQEKTVGRYKFSGAFLDRDDDPANLDLDPLFVSDPAAAGDKVPIDSHVRKANPRRAAERDADRKIFRRGYPLIAAKPDGFDRGLLFVAFARSLSTQFDFIFRAWMLNENFPEPGAGKDRLFEKETAVLAGGYFFVPPLTHKHDAASWVIPPADA